MPSAPHIAYPLAISTPWLKIATYVIGFALTMWPNG
ncbi:hypothetical protein QBC98_004038 [Kitasatospora acidiphila]